MSKTVWWSIVVFGMALVAAILYYAIPKAHREPDLQFPPPAVTSEAPAPESQTHFPVPPDAEGKGLPALAESDPAVRDALGTLWNTKNVAQLFQLNDFIRRVVVTVDNLPRRKLALRLMPVTPAAGTFLVAGSSDAYTVMPDNAVRYAPYVRLAEAVDAHKLVGVYMRFYPLFQQAYQELGYPDGYFNDRLVEVIDDLLDTPDVKEPLKLVRPKVFYQFADPELEAASAGEKILLRMGQHNAARVKEKLREIRGELVRQTPTQ